MSEATATRFPLTWPQGQAITPSTARSSAHFKVTFERTRKQLFNALGLLHAFEIILSTNLPVREDGMPFAAARVRPADASPGVAVYFLRGVYATPGSSSTARPYVFACDTYQTVDANLRAIYLTVEAFRTMQRHGASAMLERAFTGFAALPPAGGEVNPWWIVLEVARDMDPRDIKVAYRRLAATHHPDNGGDAETFSRITRAYEEAQKELGFQ